MKLLRLAGAVLVTAFAALGAFAQGDYPSKPIRLIVPFTAGSGTDAVARYIAEKINGGLGVTAYVENRPGASGMLGSDVVARAEPDGYTLLVAVTSHVTNPALYKEKVPYNTDRDFAPIALIATTPAILFTSARSPFKSLPEVVRYAKEHPGSLSYASSGTGNTPHLALELFKQAAGLDLTHVPYKGAAASVPDLVGGHIPLAVSLMGTFAGVYKEGRVGALAVAAKSRMASAPNVPTFSELGYPDVVASEWFGLLAPARTPGPVVARLNREVNRILALPETRDRFTNLGVDAAGGSPEQFQAFMSDAKTRWAKVIQAGNIQLP